MISPLDSEDRDKQQVQKEAEIAAMFDGTITLIAAIRCYGSGKQRQRCQHHLNLYPALPEETITLTKAKNHARHHGWQRKQRDGYHVWICPDCL